MDYNQLERDIFNNIRQGQWDKAINKAKLMPSNWDVTQKFPSAAGDAGMPDDAIHKTLDLILSHPARKDQNLSSFLFELSSNLPPTTSNETLNRLAKLGGNEGYYFTNKIQEHPNFKLDQDEDNIKKVSDFWASYEKGVNPDHFATIKSHYSKQPETIETHRGTGTSIGHEDLIPHIDKHSKRVQDEVLKDPSIKKRFKEGKWHIKLYRGVGGDYAQAIRDHVGHDTKDNSVADKRFRLDSGPFTSWSAEPGLAGGFAHLRDILGDKAEHKGVVIEKWHPIENVLHSGFHTTVFGQEHPHQSENEIIVGHPKGHIVVSSKNLHTVTPNIGYGETKPVKVRPKE